MFRIDRPQPRPYEPVAEAEAPRAWRVVLISLALGTCAAGVILLQILGGAVMTRAHDRLSPCASVFSFPDAPTCGRLVGLSPVAGRISSSFASRSLLTVAGTQRNTGGVGNVRQVIGVDRGSSNG